MKAITIRQPWASAIAAGAKTVENRGRDCAYRGLIAIHAGKTPDTAADRDPRIVRLFGRDPRLLMPMGAVIMVADLVDCHEAKLTGRKFGSEPCCAPWGENSHNGKQPAYHLVLDNVRWLPKPVPCAGKLWFPWDLPGDVATAVERQLAVAL